MVTATTVIDGSILLFLFCFCSVLVSVLVSFRLVWFTALFEKTNQTPTPFFFYFVLFLLHPILFFLVEAE